MTVAAFLLNMPLDVLDHNDRIVDDEAGRECDAKHCERVDGETEDLDEGKSTDERNRDGDSWNDGCTPVLQEKEDDDDHDDDGFDDRLDHFFDGITYHRGRIEGDDVLEPRRERLRQVFEDGLALLVDLKSICV